MRARVNTIAEPLGSQAREIAGHQHYRATRSFGPFEHRSIGICKHKYQNRQGRHDAF
jgi:hypothetical protein